MDYIQTNILEISALLLSIIAILYTHKYNKLVMGSLEIQLNQSISESKINVQNILLEMVELSAKIDYLKEEKKEIDALTKFQMKEYGNILKMAMENQLNSYEVACAKYLDNKIDKDRFKKIYHLEIRKIVESKSHKDKFDATTSSYKAILKVYDEWNNLEK